MNSILLILPFLALELLKKQSFKNTLLALAATFPIIPIFSIFPLFPFYPVLLLLCFVNAFHIRIFNYPLNIKALKLIRHFSSLKDSIREQIPLWMLTVVILFSLFYPLLLVKSSIWSAFLLPLLFICPKRLLPYPYQPISLLFEKRNHRKGQKIPDPENEIFYKDNSSYPLEKFTSGFSGKKVFSLPGKSPHVVFIYLESFKSTEIGKITPYFDALCKQGIYFSNFYAAASQTFKAMFATLYGIPPCFGTDFTESSSTVLTLPLCGLPNIFKDHGYRNVFIKAGRHTFENQGQFLKNHLFDEILDEKEIKNANAEAYGTSWGVHDEFLYTHLAAFIKEAKSPLFIHAASVTNHHPFILPHDFIPKFGTTPFQKTMEYSDFALSLAVEQLRQLQIPIHLYIMGDHGYPKDHDKKPFLSPSLDKEVTHVPLLILPMHCGEFKPLEIHTVASQIDLLPTLMDVYGFSGKNSSLGSSLCRERKNPIAYLLNESVVKVSGEVTFDEYKTFKGYHPLYETVAPLFKEKKISTEKSDLRSLNFSSCSIPNQAIAQFLSNNKNLEALYLENSPLIFSLNLPFPKTLHTLTLDNNIMIDDTDIVYLPKGIKTLSIVGCRNLTDVSLLSLSNYPINELTISCSNFSIKALTEFVKQIPLQKLHLKEAKELSEEFFHALSNKSIKEIILSGCKNLSDTSLKCIANPSLKILMADHCEYITDLGLFHLKNTSLEVLHLENSYNISDSGIEQIHTLPIHTFYISKSSLITEDTIKKLHTPSMQNLFCIDCELLPQVIKDGSEKQILYLQKKLVTPHTCFDRYLNTLYTAENKNS
jgi:phosphoglycerol transferase MdoB-like AlkP superfamily enzyme